MISLKDLLMENPNQITVYRGVDPKFGDVERGRMSIGIKHKLVGALGANFTDSSEIASKYGKKIIGKTISLSRILELDSYDDIIRLYQKYENQLPANLAKNIKNSQGKEQFEYIKQAANDLRDILKKRYDAIKTPLGPGDSEYLTTKGLRGNMYIVLI